MSRRNALMVAATTLFAEKGYDATSTAEIAARAGCAQGLIRHHFSGKAGLLEAVVQQVASDTNTQLERLPLQETLVEEVLQLFLWQVNERQNPIRRIILSRLLVNDKELEHYRQGYGR